MSYGYATFDTAIGPCGIAWSAHGVSAVQLPEANEPSTVARLLRRFPAAELATPPAEIQRTIDGIVGLLAGEPRDLSTIRLDMADVAPLDRRVYDITRTIPAGATLSYGEIASRLGDAGLARAVGQALGRNPFAIVVPCHRVVAADQRLGGFSANGGVAMKSRLLAIESAQRSLRLTPS